MWTIDVFAKVIYYLWKSKQVRGMTVDFYTMHARLLVEESSSWGHYD